MIVVFTKERKVGKKMNRKNVERDLEYALARRDYWTREFDARLNTDENDMEYVYRHQYVDQARRERDLAMWAVIGLRRELADMDSAE